MLNITYIVKNGIYINLTNRCTNRCDFCIREAGEGVYGSDSLWLEREPEAVEVIDDLKKYDFSKYNELVFCGYGEPTIRINELCEIASWVKENTALRVRINTNGHGNLIHKTDITSRFNGIIDIISISMNAPDAEKYAKICKSVFENAFQGLLDFGRLASRYVPQIIFSVVRTTIPDEDIEICGKLAIDYGGSLRIRDCD